MSLKMFEVWAKGYGGTEEKPEDVHLASVEATTFEEACQNLARNDPSFREQFDEAKLTARGCKLFNLPS